MGKRGPKKTPTAVLENRGSWRAKVRGGEPRPKVSYPPCPEWMSPIAADIWNKLVPDLVNLGVMTELDSFSFGRYCTYAVLWLAELGSDDRKETTLEKYANQLSKIEREFGLTPSSRASLSVKEPEEKKDGYLKIV